MAIGSVVPRGTTIYIYDEKGQQIGAIPGGDGPNSGLQGYTAATVSIKRGSVIYTYDEKGYQKSSVQAG